MKNVFASLLVLCCLTAPAYAAQGWDGTLPDALVILPPEEVDGDAYNSMLKKMADELSPGLNKVGAHVHMVPTSAVAPIYGDEWPDFVPYQKSVRDLYLELRSIKKMKSFVPLLGKGGLILLSSWPGPTQKAVPSCPRPLIYIFWKRIFMMPGQTWMLSSIPW